MSYEQEHRLSLPVKAQADFRGIFKEEFTEQSQPWPPKLEHSEIKGPFEIGSPNLERLVMTLD
jgi:hypothetical protein